MSIQKIIQESINGNPLEMKEALQEELRDRIRLALEAKMDEDMKEEVELDESWSDGINSRTQHVFARKAAMDMQKANAARKYAKGYPTDHPQHNKNMADYHSAMAKYVKNSYHAGQYGSQSDAKPDHKEHMTAAKEYRAKSNMSEEVEELDELKKSTLASYVKKASQSAADNAEKSGKHYEKSTNASDIDTADRYFDSYAAKGVKSTKRLKGISRAVDRLAKEEFDLSDLTLEELEGFMESAEFDQLDELDKKTLTSYVKKASKDAASKSGTAEYEAGRAHDKIYNQQPDHSSASFWTKRSQKSSEKAGKRLQGISRATDRLAK